MKLAASLDDLDVYDITSGMLSCVKAIVHGCHELDNPLQIKDCMTWSPTGIYTLTEPKQLHTSVRDPLH